MYGPRAHNVTVEGLAQLIMGGSVRIDAGFTDLLHSGLIEKMSARPDTTQVLERLTDRILAFELHGDTGGLPTF